MPVFSTLGALTYTKLNNTDSGNNFGLYWYIETNNNVTLKNISGQNIQNVFIVGSYPESSNTNTLYAKLIDNSLPSYAPFIQFGSSEDSGIIGDLKFVARDTGNTANMIFCGTSNGSSGNGTPTLPGIFVRVNANLEPNTAGNTLSLNIIGDNAEQVATMACANGGGVSGIWTVSHAANTSNGGRRLLYGLSSVNNRSIINLGSGANANNFASLLITSTRENIVTYSNSIFKFANTQSGSPLRYALLYRKDLSLSGNIVATLDNTGANVLFVCDDAGVYGKIDANSGNTVFLKDINFTKPTSIKLDGSNVYIVGNRVVSSPSGRNIYVSKFDDTGNNIWQNEFDGPLNFTSYDVETTSTGLLIVGITSNNTSFILKVPQDGNIPGNGNYVGITGNYQYFASNASISNSGATLGNGLLTTSGENQAPVSATFDRNFYSIPITVNVL